MGEKRALASVAVTPLSGNAPPGVLSVLDDLSSMILGQLATRRKLQAILETISDQIEVDSARFVLTCRLGRESGGTAPAADRRDKQLSAALRGYPGIRESITRGTGTVVENDGTLGRTSLRNTTGSLSVPVCRAGRIIGLLCISTSRGRGSFSPWEVDFCSILANMAGAALTDVR